MRSPLHLREPEVHELAPRAIVDESFCRRQAALRHQRRSRRIRTITTNLLWTLALLLIAGFIGLELISGFKLA
jgi:hypothetical protein